MNKKILIPGWKVGENSFGVTIAYMEYLSQFGEVQILSLSKEIQKGDLLVLPGGPDTLASNYGGVPSYHNTSPDLAKEFFYHQNLQGYIDSEIPIFGICLGMQMLNVKFGGELTQNCFHPYSEDSRSDLVHTLKLRDGLNFKFGGTKKEPKYLVNSMHHQGVALNDMPAEFDWIAMGPNKIVEAFGHQTRKIAGVQWHPEEIYDPLAAHLINSLLNGERVEEPADFIQGEAV